MDTSVSFHPSTPPPLEGGGWGEGECINNSEEFHIFFTPTFTLLNFPKGTVFNGAGPPPFQPFGRSAVVAEATMAKSARSQCFGEVGS